MWWLWLSAIRHVIAQRGLDAFDHRQAGVYVAFQPYELAAAVSRLRTLRVK